MSRKNVEDIYPLSPLQQGMLFHALYSPETGAYVEQWPLMVEGGLDLDAHERALQRTVERHPALRTGLLWQNVPQPLQVVFREAPVESVRLDWSDRADEAWRSCPRSWRTTGGADSISPARRCCARHTSGWTGSGGSSSSPSTT